MSVREYDDELFEIRLRKYLIQKRISLENVFKWLGKTPMFVSRLQRDPPTSFFPRNISRNCVSKSTTTLKEHHNGI
jgi:hypothetical protein